MDDIFSQLKITKGKYYRKRKFPKDEQDDEEKIAPKEAKITPENMMYTDGAKYAEIVEVSNLAINSQVDMVMPIHFLYSIMHRIHCLLLHI